MPDHPGQPTLYRPEYCQQVIDHMAQGYPLETFAAVIGVSRMTLYNWAEANPEFFDSIKRGRDLSLKWYMDAGRAGMGGKIPGFNATVWIFMLKNLHKWRETDGDVIDKLGLTTQNAAPSAMTHEQKVAYARQLRNQLDDFLGANEPIRTRDALGMESETQPGGEADRVDPIPLASGDTKR